MLTWIRERAWVPASVLLLAGAGGLGLLDILRGPLAWVSVGVGLVLLAAFAGRNWRLRRAPAPAARPARPSLKVIQGGKTLPYDLEADESTNNQRYLM
jgi:hypothetical protein